MSANEGGVLNLLLSLALVGFFIMCFVAYYELKIDLSYKKLKKNNCISPNIDYEFYRNFYKVLLKRLDCFDFKITYFKDEIIVIKIKKDYFTLTEDCSLIHLFNEDNLIIDKMKKAKNKVPKY